MKCISCNSKTEAKNVDVEQFGVSLGKFSADVCQKCGETYYSEETYQKIEDAAKNKGVFGLAEEVVLRKMGASSVGITIPKHIVEFMNLRTDKKAVIYPSAKDKLVVEIRP